MRKLLARDLAEATRLTRSGRLGEATALLQKSLRGVDIPDNASASRNAAALTDSGAASGSLGIHLPAAVRRMLHSLEPAVPARVPGAARRGPGATSDVHPSPGLFLAKSFSNEAGSRAYKLYIPSGKHDQPRPLIVMLHGCTQSPDDFAAGTRMNHRAEEHACFVVYPEQAASANASRCWNWFHSGHQERDQGEPSLIAGIVRQVMADHPIDPRRIYVAGLSAGGAAAAVAGETYPDVFAAVGVHSGLPCGSASDLNSALAAMRGDRPAAGNAGSKTPSRHLPTIVFHGDRDTTVHPRNGAEVVARASTRPGLEVSVENGRAAAGHSFTRTVQRDASGQAILEQWEVHGAGHAWSGGSPAGSFTDPKGPDATAEMLRFFLEHTRPGH